MIECRRCWVQGRVQGVWFRAGTREQAQSLGLNGYVRNLADGRVEVLACGAASAIAELLDWLRVGPPLAEVGEVNCERVPLDGALSGFTVQ